jgi:hypothetical protein
MRGGAFRGRRQRLSLRVFLETGIAGVGSLISRSRTSPSSTRGGVGSIEAMFSLTQAAAFLVDSSVPALPSVDCSHMESS